MELHILEHRVRVLSLARQGLWLYTHPLIKLLFLPHRSRCAPGFGGADGGGRFTVFPGQGWRVRIVARRAGAGRQALPLRPPSGLGLPSPGPPPIRSRRPQPKASQGANSLEWAMLNSEWCEVGAFLPGHCGELLPDVSHQVRGAGVGAQGPMPLVLSRV